MIRDGVAEHKLQVRSGASSYSTRISSNLVPAAVCVGLSDIYVHASAAARCMHTVKATWSVPADQIQKCLRFSLCPAETSQHRKCLSSEVGAFLFGNVFVNQRKIQKSTRWKIILN